MLLLPAQVSDTLDATGHGSMGWRRVIEWEGELRGVLDGFLLFLG